MLRRSWFLLLLAITTSAHYVTAQSSLSALTRHFEIFASDDALRNASWAFEVVEAKTGRVIISHNSHLSLTPASTQKLLTTATALMMLGSDYRFSTELIARGIIDHNGVLHGDLIIKGSGDPSFGSSQMADSLSLQNVFNKYLLDLRSKGISKITGSIIADDSVFDRELVPRKWLWEDIGNYYGAGSSGLTVNENMYTVFFRAGQGIGDAATVIETQPTVPGMVLINEVKTAASGTGDQVYILGAPYSNTRLLTGTVPAGSNRFPVRGSMHDPPAFVAAAFNEFLKINKIETSGKTLTIAQEVKIPELVFAPTQVISTWLSPPIRDIASRTNLSSNNTYAESLLKTLGLQHSGQGSFKAGIEAIYSFWDNNKVDIRGMRLHDGSGLSPSNRITVRQLTSILAFCSNNLVYDNLKSGLPVAGVSGSLQNHFLNTASQGILTAKSGFLSNVRSYAGYTTLKDGTLVAFALIVNDYHGSPSQMRNKMFSLMNAITLYDNIQQSDHSNK
jgi:serine-type D-Ala-D-Ala carboxypeptidase/endopeptidase (penicillin-binding protein 4)